jgi:hypothetical protein
MSYEVIKTIGGRRYRYLQKTYRVGGKVKTKSIYLGPVDPPRRRKLDFRGLLPGVAQILFEALKGGGRSHSYKSKDRPSGRDRQSHQAAMRALLRQYGVDASSPKAFNATRALLTPEQNSELTLKMIGMSRGVRSSARTAPSKPPLDWSRLEAKLATDKAAQAARQTPQDAPGRTEAPAAKNFTVDDEIEAREAKFEAAVDEYNAGTTAAPDSPAPSDAPSPDAKT